MFFFSSCYDSGQRAQECWWWPVIGDDRSDTMFAICHFYCLTVLLTPKVEWYIYYVNAGQVSNTYIVDISIYAATPPSQTCLNVYQQRPVCTNIPIWERGTRQWKTTHNTYFNITFYHFLHFSMNTSNNHHHCHHHHHQWQRAGVMRGSICAES